MLAAAGRLRRLLASAALLAAATALTPSPARAYLPPSYGGSLTVPLFGGVVALAPWKASRPAELQIGMLLFDTLYRRRGAKVFPHLVTGVPKLSDQGRSVRLKIRAGVTLHDGKELTASQVARSLERTRRGLHSYLLAGIKGFSAQGKSVLLVRLASANPRLLWQLSARASAIAVRRGGQLIGTGPFALARRRPAALTLRAHGLCFTGRPYVDTLHFKRFARSSAEVASFQIGSSQLSFHGASVFGGTPRHKPDLMKVAGAQTFLLSFGQGRPFLADRALRRAISAGVDRRRLARLVGGQVARGPLSARLWRYRRPRGSGFDRRIAARYKRLAAKRFAELASPRVQLSLLVDKSRPDDRKLAGQIVADLDRVGFAVTIDARQPVLFQQLVESGSYTLALRRHAPQSADRRLALASALALAGEATQARRCALGRCAVRVARRYGSRLPAIPLVHATLRIHFDARLGGLAVDPAGRLRFASVFWLRGARSGS
jgi:MarR-like DNA-binding transcriptional regulator SgrR of sgrS sRNA